MVTKKDQILDTSLQLFMKKGFDATSISDILSQLDIARGTLYYHFESKEAIMDAIIERLLNQVLKKIEKLMTNDSLSQAEKFMGFFASINLTQLTGDEEIVDYFNQPQKLSRISSIFGTFGRKASTSLSLSNMASESL